MGLHEKNWKRICWSGLVFYLVAICVASGCSKGFFGKVPDAEKTWTCDNAADEAMKRRDYETAIPLHKNILEEEPANALVLYHLGYAHGQLGDHKKEVSYYEKAIALGI